MPISAPTAPRRARDAAGRSTTWSPPWSGTGCSGSSGRRFDPSANLASRGKERTLKKLARRVGKIQPSPTLAITSKAKAMKAQGIDVVGLGGGEPDFDTPHHIKAVAKKALEDGYTKDPPVSGTPELKDAIIAKLKRDSGLEYKRENIIVSLC